MAPIGASADKPPDTGPGAVTVGDRPPGRTVPVRSYSKSHGPDLRIAVLGGAAETVERVRVLRSFGTGRTSRILLATSRLDDDPAAVGEIADIIAMAAARDRDR